MRGVRRRCPRAPRPGTPARARTARAARSIAGVARFRRPAPDLFPVLGRGPGGEVLPRRATLPPARVVGYIATPHGPIHRRAEAHPRLRRPAREGRRGRRSSSSAGSRATATTAAASSSICATARASRSSSSTRSSRATAICPRKAHDVARALRSEWVVGVRGVVKSRGANKNPKLPTGEIEVHAIELDGLQQERDAALRDRRRDRHGRGEAPPVPLPRPAPRAACRRRSACGTASHQTVRRYFDEAGFLELETPMMVKYTPGGARNFLVPSRMHAGQVLRAGREPAALQAALHGGGVRAVLPDREVLPRRGAPPRPAARVHADRRRDVLRRTRTTSSGSIEGLVFRVWKEVARRRPERRSTRAGASRRCRSRSRWASTATTSRTCASGSTHTDLTDVVVEHGGGGVPFWKPIADKFTSGQYRRDLPAEIVKALRIPADLASKLSRTEVDKLEDFVKGMGAKGLARAKVDAEGQLGAVAARQDDHAGAARGDQRARRREGRGPPALPVRPRGGRADGDGEPAPPPGQAARPHPGERARRASGTSSGS